MRHFLILPLILMIFISSCSQEDKDQTENKTQPKPHPELKLAEFNSKAWLRKELPQDALVYLRAPNLWFLVPGLDNGFKYAQGNEQHVKQLQLIQKGLYENLISKMQQTTRPLAELLVKHMAGPLELAVLNNPDTPTMPNLLLATTLEFKQAANFTKSLEELIEQQPMLQLSQKTDANGQGLLTITPMGINALYQFDQKTGRLTMITGMASDKSQLQSLLTQVKPSQTHVMYKTEEKIDASGKGLFGFINTKAILPIAQKMLPPEMMAGLQMSGADKLNALAFGYGSSNSKTRLKILADMPVAGFRAYLPTANNNLDINARGEISAVAVLALPTEVEFKRIESTIIMMNGAAPEYTKSKLEFKTNTGFSIEQILGMIGPEVVYFSDDISDFLAIRLANQQQFSQLLKSAADKGWIEYNDYQKNGLTIKHVATQLMSSSNATDAMLAEHPIIAEMLSNIKSHYYWVEEDGYLISSGIPQPLIERHQRKDITSVKNWLVNSQKQDLSSAFLGYTTSQLNISRKSYYVYLQILNALADMSGADVDAFALPHAGQVGFGDKGSIGFNLDFDEQYLALEFNFEQSLFDALYGNIYQSAAVVGILAAVAMPAYQDYILRSKIESVSASTSALRNEISNQLQSGRTADQVEISDQKVKELLTPGLDLVQSIKVVKGKVVVHFSKHISPQILSGTSLSFSPYLNQQTGGVSWQCQSEFLTTKHFPSICKN